MAGSSTTKAEIPWEYSYLSQNTGSTLARIQKYLWGDPDAWSGLPTDSGGGTGGGTKVPIESAPPTSASGKTGGINVGGTIYYPDGTSEPAVTSAPGTGTGTGGDIDQPDTITPSTPPTGTTDPATGLPYGGEQMGLNWLTPNVREVLDPNYVQAEALSSAWGAGNRPEESTAAINNAYQNAGAAWTPANVDLQNAPNIKAAYDVFNQQVAPQMQNEYEMYGLGHSTALPAETAKARATMMPALITQAQTAEENRLNRGLTGGQQLTTTLAGQGAESTARQQQRATQLQGMGTEFQTIRQAQANAPYEAQQQLQSLAENAAFGPLGNFVPSAIGSTTKGK